MLPLEVETRIARSCFNDVTSPLIPSVLGLIIAIKNKKA